MASLKALLRGPALALALVALAGCGPATPTAEVPLPSAPSAPPAPPSPPPLVVEPDAAAAARIAADVTYLASPELAGRGTGEEGARLAADFVAKRFADMKLVPYGARNEQAPASYLQAFQARVGAKVDAVSLEVSRVRGGAASSQGAGPVLAADGAASGTAEGQAVFVGFGITAQAAGWDDYAGADLGGKVAIILDGVPAAPNKPAAGAALAASALRDFGSVRYKLRTAREHGAAGALIVRAGDEPSTAAPVDPSSMGIPAVVASRKLAAGLFPSLRLADARAWEPTKSGKPRDLPADQVRITTKISPVEAAAWNVAGLLPAREGSPNAAEVVVVGAHYDHLGHGGPHSRAPGVREVHPGADDNASGTALLLEVARRLGSLPGALDRSVLFLAFGAEEIGCIGSRYWVEHPTLPLERVVAMINADMVGRLREGRLVVDGVGTSPGWRPLVDAAARGLDLDLAFGAEGFGASDHASFTAVRVPVAFFFTGVHEDYHRPSDTADKINAEGEARVATLAARLALGVAEAPKRLAFVDAPADPHHGMRGGFKVSLGTIPDYAFAGKGVRLDGVRPDAPAARGGLARGDVIVKVGPHDIGNIHDYMFALGELEPGRQVVIEVERNGQRVPLQVVPAPGR